MIPDPELLKKELVFKTSRSGGSGGQHVNKVSSKVELRFDIPASVVLNQEQKEKLLRSLENRLKGQGILIITAQEDRSQFANREIALEKFFSLITKSLAERKKRKPTKATKASVEKRLLSKKRKSAVKKLRTGHRNSFDA